MFLFYVNVSILYKMISRIHKSRFQTNKHTYEAYKSALKRHCTGYK